MCRTFRNRSVVGGNVVSVLSTVRWTKWTPVRVLLFRCLLIVVVIGVSSLMKLWPKPPLSLVLKCFRRPFRSNRLRFSGPVIGISLTILPSKFRVLSLARCPPSLYVACTFGNLLVRRSVRTQVPCLFPLK